MTFTLVRATLADADRVSAFAAINFYPYEPLNLAMTKATGRVDYPGERDLEYVTQYLPQGLSLLAVEGDDVIGIALLRVIDTNNRSAIAQDLKAATALDEKIFYSLYVHVERDAGFWEEGDPEKAVELHILAVGVAARGKGVGKALIEGAWQVARDEGYRLFRMDCTGYYSAQLAKAVGMTCIYSLPYHDYKDESGEVVLKMQKPHRDLKIFKKKL